MQFYDTWYDTKSLKCSSDMIVIMQCLTLDNHISMLHSFHISFINLFRYGKQGNILLYIFNSLYNYIIDMKEGKLEGSYHQVFYVLLLTMHLWSDLIWKLIMLIPMIVQKIWMKKRIQFKGRIRNFPQLRKSLQSWSKLSLWLLMGCWQFVETLPPR